jgi:hypothetical protein
MLSLTVLVLSAAVGCTSNTPAPAASSAVPSTAATSAPASGPATPTAPSAGEAGSGPITTPAPTSKQRTAIIGAVASALGLHKGVSASQLFVQGGAAVGDLHTASGQRVFFAAVGGPSAWKLAWSAPFGSAAANAKELAGSDPSALTELSKMLDFKLAIANPAPSGTSGPTLKSFQTYALKTAKDLAGATYTGVFKVQAKIAKDSKGTWWGNAIAEPSDAGLESIGVWARWDGKAWSGEIADFSTEGADAAFFPADVLPKLAL